MDVNVELKRAGLATRLVYSVGLFSLLPATLVVNSGWIALATGGSIAATWGVTANLVIAAGIVFRIYQVARYRHALDAYVSSKLLAVVRILSYVAMLVGGVAGIGLLMIRPLALLVFKTPGDAGVAFFVTGLVLVTCASVGWKGCLAFEVSRWLGKKPPQVAESPTFRWKQDAVVAGLLVGLFLGGYYWKRATAPTPCGQERIDCIANVQSEITRMVAVPLDTPVKLESSINSIRMQVRSGSEVRWEVIESPYTSLQSSGYPPSDEASLRVRVKVDAHENSEGVVVDMSVWDAGDKTGRFAISFPPGSRLERDEQGRLDVIAELPWTSDSSVKVADRDDRGRAHTLDRLFVSLRKAIGTELEARENSLRLERAAVLATHTDHVQVTRSIEDWRLNRHVKGRCGDRVAGKRDVKVRSHALADRGWGLMSLDINPSSGAPKQILVHGTDNIVCQGDTVWIVHAVPLESSISIRRYALDGTLLRFVESPLPPVGTERRFAFVDAATVRESDDAIWFDRIEIEHSRDFSDPDKVVGRDTFRIPLAELP